MTPHCVYYCYNAKSEILYIGCTKNVVSRFSQHKKTSAWVPDLHKVRLRWFACFEEARLFEEKAISRNRPEYNRLVATTVNGKMTWVKPDRNKSLLDDVSLKRFKSIRASLKRRCVIRSERKAQDKQP